MMISNWDGIDPTDFYMSELALHPIYWDESNYTWVVYSYHLCKIILTHPSAHIPAIQHHNAASLSHKAAALIKKLARLSNNGQHTDARAAALFIYNCIQKVPVTGILDSLMADVKTGADFDWVATACKKLPVTLILKGLAFADADCVYITNHIATLVKVMSPNLSLSDIPIINDVIERFYQIVEQHIHSAQFTDLRVQNDIAITSHELSDLLVCNLIGLLIQCYDAGRGLLCNSVISLVKTVKAGRPHHLDYHKKVVDETLRLYPPVHHTRRVAVDDIELGNHVIKAGQSILIVLVAANLDATVFSNPLLFDCERPNNNQHLTFGAGGHACLAKYFCIDMAAAVLLYLDEKYSHISIPQQPMAYEPQLNVKLLKTLKLNIY